MLMTLVRCYAAQSPGFLKELAAITTTWMADLFVPHSKRLPDYKLLEVLEEHKAGLPSTAVLKRALEDSIAEPEPIILPGGVKIDVSAMRSLLEKGMGLPPHRNATTREAAKDKEKMAVVNDDEKLADDKLSVSPSDPFRLANLEDGGGKEVMTEGQEDEEELLRDLVARYAKESAVLSREEDDTMYLLRVEHLKRELSMFRAAQHLHANASALETSISKMAETLLPPEQVEHACVRSARLVPPLSGSALQACSRAHCLSNLYPTFTIVSPARESSVSECVNEGLKPSLDSMRASTSMRA